MMPIEEFRRLSERDEIKAISVDIFDTLLLRGTRCEMLRFRKVAELQHRALKEKMKAPPTASDLYEGRLLAAKIAYRNAEPVKGQREPDFPLILELLCHAIHLDHGFATLLRDVEIAQEKKVLQGNRKLAAILSRAQGRGKRVFFISDMYLSCEDIRELVGHRLPDLRFDGEFVSSEIGQSKRGGGLFDHVCEVESLSPDEIAHAGDNYLSDVQVPLARGWRAVFTPRPAWWRLAGRSSHRLYSWSRRAGFTW